MPEQKVVMLQLSIDEADLVSRSLLHSFAVVKDCKPANVALATMLVNIALARIGELGFCNLVTRVQLLRNASKHGMPDLMHEELLQSESRVNPEGGQET